MSTQEDIALQIMLKVIEVSPDKFADPVRDDTESALDRNKKLAECYAEFYNVLLANLKLL